MKGTSMDDNQDFSGFAFQVALYYNGEDLRVASTDSVDEGTLHEMLTTALWALEQRMAGLSVQPVRH
jgi:hypothetical protein